MVVRGLRPTKDQRLQRSACSTDSSRKPGRSPTRRAKAATGVVMSATSSRHTGTTLWSRARAWKSSREGWYTAVVVLQVVVAGAGSGSFPASSGCPKARKKHERSPVWQAPRPSWSTMNNNVSPSQS